MEVRKAQIGVAGFILIMMLLLIGYLFLLPPSEKCKILPDLRICSESGITSGTSTGTSTLLSESPGLILPIEDSAEYSLGSVELLNREESEIPFMISADPTVERAWFRNKKILQDFTVPGKPTRVILFITISESSSFATLKVKINGNEVSKIRGNDVHIIEVPISYVKEDNMLELEASAPLLPGQTSQFKLISLIIKEKYSETQPSLERNFALIQNPENIKSAVLSFDADCYSEDPLVIELNDKKIINEKICSELSQEISDFLQQDNKFVFSTNGNYFIHDIKIKIRQQEKDYPTYFFALSQEDYNRIKDGKVLAMLKFKFPEKDKKELTVYINGNPLSIETTKTDYKTAISRLLLQGQNSVRIVPTTRVTLGSIELYLGSD